MQITIIAPVLGEENNGTTVAIMNLIRAMEAKGHKVNVVCPDKDKKGLPGYYIVPLTNYGPLNLIFKANNVTVAKADKKIIREACKGSDIVHVTVPVFLGGNCAKFIKNELGLPVTASFHCQAENFSSHIFNFMGNELFNNYLYKRYNRKLYSYCSAVHYPTDFIRNEFEQVVGKTNDYVISNGVKDTIKKIEVEKDERFKDKKIILFTGRFAKEKSHDVLVRAVSLSKYESDIQLVFAGKGPREKHIRKLSSKILTNQPLIGFFTSEELNRIINTADLYVHPAHAEIEAIACLEAIKCGAVPVIANSPKCATKAFALDERSLFKAGDAKDLSDKIDYWFDNEEERKRMSVVYQESASVLSVETCMDQMESMFHDVINNEKKSNLLSR